MFKFTQAVIKQTLPAARSFSTYKTSTGLVGLAVDVNGRETLLDLSSKIMEAVKPIPASSQYRINVEKWFTFIPKVVQGTQDIKKIEEEIALGQIEEVIEMAKDELELVSFYIEHKGWEQVEEAHQEADTMIEKMADSIYFTNPDAKAKFVPPPPAAPATPAAPAAAAPAAKKP